MPTIADMGLSPKLLKLREKHHTVRRESLQQLALSKNALERRSSVGDQTVDTASSSSMTSVRVTKLPHHEQLPVMMEASGRTECLSVSSREESELKTPRTLHIDTNATNVEDSPSEITSVTPKDHSFESSVGLHTTTLPSGRMVHNISQVSHEGAPDSQRLEQLRNKHRLVRNLSIHKLELSKSALERFNSSASDIDLDDENSSSTSSAPRLPHYKQVTFEEENEDLKEQIAALLISQAAARKEYLVQAEIIRKLGVGVRSADYSEMEAFLEQRLKETSLRRDMLQKSVQDDQQLIQEQQRELERLQEILSKTQEQVETVKSQLERHQDPPLWVKSWIHSTGQEARHFGSFLRGLEVTDPESQKYMEALRDRFSEWAHMEELAHSESSSRQNESLDVSSEWEGESPARTLASGSDRLSAETDLTQSVVAMLALLKEMQAMVTSHSDESSRSSEGQPQFSVSPSFIPGSEVIRIRSIASSSSFWTPSCALTLMLSTRQQQALMKGIRSQISQIQELEEQENELKSQLELAKHQSVPETNGDHQDSSAHTLMLEKQVQKLQEENAALLSRIQDHEQRALSTSRSKDKIERLPSSSDHSTKSKVTTEAERNKLAFDTAQAYFVRKKELQQQEEEQSQHSVELSVRQMNLSMAVVSSSPRRSIRSSARASSFRSLSILDEAEPPSNRRQSRLLSRHVIGQNESRRSGAKIPLIFVDEIKVERAEQVQQEALESKLKRFLGLNW